MIEDTKINFNIIRERVSAAESLQEAGERDDAYDILTKLAKDILKK